MLTGSTRAMVAWALGLALMVTMLAAPRLGAAAPKPSLISILAGALEDSARGAAIDAEGNYYVTGGTGSPDFPVTAGAYQTTFDQRDPSANGADFGPHDVWVAKFSPTGDLLWSTFVGGPGYDRAYSVEVDATGVYVGGRAGIGFPTTRSSLQPDFAGDVVDMNRGYGPQDGFVLKLSPDGGHLLWSTYFGDAGRGFLRDIAVDGAGYVYVMETAVDAPNPHVTRDSFGPVKPTGQSAVVAKLSADGSRVIWGGYLGGSGQDLTNASVRVDALGQVFVAGGTTSDDFPVTEGAFQTERRGPSDMVLTGIASDGRALLFSTYLGGSGEEGAETHCLALGPDGSVYVAAYTKSADFPTTAGAFQERAGGWGETIDGFVARFTAAGSLLEATRIGGRDHDWIEGVGTDASGRVIVVGGTKSSDLPTSSDPYQAANAGGADMFVSVFPPELGDLLYGSYLGGRGDDSGRSAAVAPGGTLVVGGMTVGSDDLRTTNGSSISGTGVDAVTARDVMVVAFAP